MTSSNSILRAPRIEQVATTLGARSVDPATRAAISDARASAFAEGHAAGKREAVLEARSALERATEILDAAIANGRSQITQTIADHTGEVVQLAVTIARRVVGDLPEGAGTDLADKLAAALERIDDPELVIRVSPNDAITLAPVFEHRTNVTLIRDNSIHEGDAFLSGRWAQADLRMATAWKLAADEFDV